MKSIPFFYLLFLCITTSIAQKETNFNTDTEMDQLLESIVSKKESIGITAGYVVNGKYWASTKGYKDQKNKLPFESNTKTRTASIAKPMTAIAILQLYEQGKLNLDAAVQEYLPGFPIKPEGVITVRHLLEHSSGIGAYASNKERQNKIAYSSLTDVFQVFQERDLLTKPGEAFNYTTYGYVMLGAIIESVSGMYYEDYMKQNIWKKAGMEHTSVEVFGKEETNKSLLYHKNKKGKVKCMKPTNLSDRIPGGGVYSTLGDLLKFGEAVMTHKLIKAETMELMWTDSGLKKEGNGYGFGWYLYGKNPKYGQTYGHTGGQIGCSSMMMLLPEQKTAVVVLSNTSGALPEVSKLAVQLFDVAAKSSRDQN